MKVIPPGDQKVKEEPRVGVVSVHTSRQFDIDVPKHLSDTGLTILCETLGTDPFRGEPVKSLDEIVYCLEYSKNIYVLYQVSINKISGDVDKVYLASIQEKSEPESKEERKVADKKLAKFKKGAKKIGICVSIKESIDFILESLF